MGFYLFLEEEKLEYQQWTTFRQTVSEATRAQYPPVREKTGNYQKTFIKGNVLR